MNYATIRNYDIANGEGVRTSLFVSGCTNHCPGCFNPEEQDFNYGIPYTTGTFLELCKMLKDPIITGLSILGGDPLCQQSHGIVKLIELCQFVHQNGKNIWLWTGFEWDDVFFNRHYNNHGLMKQELLMSCDVVVDGPFKQELADRALKWRGSANQRIIDVQKTVQNGQITLYEE